MRILSIIAIKVPNSLLGSMFLLHPVFYKILNLFDIHELNIINMPILLSFHKDARWDTFIAHCFWIRLMIFASRINLVSNLRGREAVIALDVRWVNPLAFQLLLLQKVVERNVGYVGNKLFIKAMHTFCMGAMLAQPLNLFVLILRVYLCAI
jgi:hypothetical protein